MNALFWLGLGTSMLTGAAIGLAAQGNVWLILICVASASLPFARLRRPRRSTDDLRRLR